MEGYIMQGFGQMINILKKNPKTIVLTEGTDSRVLEASSRLLASNFLHPILIGDPDKIYEAAEDCGRDRPVLRRTFRPEG